MCCTSHKRVRALPTAWYGIYLHLSLSSKDNVQINAAVTTAASNAKKRNAQGSPPPSPSASRLSSPRAGDASMTPLQNDPSPSPISVDTLPDVPQPAPAPVVAGAEPISAIDSMPHEAPTLEHPLTAPQDDKPATTVAANDGSNATGAKASSSAVPSLNLDVPVRPPGNPTPVPKGNKKAKAS